ncbi:hypothetical protein Y88_1223 [Novosphingobium nitrogenifigens DSM 19370]|uniref:Uncharacterized protein n=1 Tax=Novosphingobium nitrogenifigens DSM 19370 TaxID=983920 RepID=F1Z865_9SPHN|nr:hypothetical protein Y88_1223 [Novosphingobium nitrogenifigens DSM 19370]
MADAAKNVGRALGAGARKRKGQASTGMIRKAVVCAQLYIYGQI